jgi:hypothetical protein
VTTSRAAANRSALERVLREEAMGLQCADAPETNQCPPPFGTEGRGCGGSSDHLHRG